MENLTTVSVILLTLLLYSQINAVITYVDNSDPEWQNQYNKYKNTIQNLTLNSQKQWRFHSMGELYFCIKSIRKFAKFISKIFLVVSSETQVPNWVKNEKNVIVVYHNNFIDNSCLPTFASTAIEANLHKIPGLGEHWIYFNDDVFIGKSCGLQDFIHNGKLVLRMTDVTSPSGQPDINEIGYISAWKNTNKMLDTIFGETSRKFTSHSPLIQKTSVHKFLEKLFKRQFKDTSSSRFRSTRIHNTTGGLFEHYVLKKEPTIVVDNDTVQIFITDNLDENIKKYNYILNTKPLFFNIQNTLTEKNLGVEYQFKEYMTKIIK